MNYVYLYSIYEIVTAEGSFQDYLIPQMSQTKSNGTNRIKREKGKLFQIILLAHFLRFASLGIQAIISIICVSFFLFQSFQLIRDYCKEETFITPAKKRLDEMPSPTISFCDKYGDRHYNTETEDVATLAVNYSSGYLESFVLPTFSKERNILSYDHQHTSTFQTI